MTEEWIDTYADLSDTAFMQIYRSPYWHTPTLKARLDQDALETGYRPDPGPTGEAAKIQAERDRRGLTYPESWIAAGILEG